MGGRFPLNKTVKYEFPNRVHIRWGVGAPVWIPPAPTRPKTGARPLRNYLEFDAFQNRFATSAAPFRPASGHAEEHAGPQKTHLMWARFGNTCFSKLFDGGRPPLRPVRFSWETKKNAFSGTLHIWGKYWKYHLKFLPELLVLNQKFWEEFEFRLLGPPQNSNASQMPCF